MFRSCDHYSVALLMFVFFLMRRRPPRSTPLYSSAASDVYKRQLLFFDSGVGGLSVLAPTRALLPAAPVSYTHLRGHETSQDLVCRLLLEKKKITAPKS